MSKPESRTSISVVRASLDTAPGPGGSFKVSSKITVSGAGKKFGSKGTNTSPFKKFKPDANSTGPIIIKSPGEYIPMPYIFRIPCTSINSQVKDGYVRSPPFYIQLDHTLAVVWSLFSNEEQQKPLGINQLQWALGFLLNIHNDHGNHPDDVKICIDAICDELIEQYAELVDDIQFIKNRNNKSRKRSIRIQNTVDLSEPFAQSSVMSVNDTRSDADLSSGNSDLLKVSVPFSLTYADMIERCPEEDTFDDGSGAGTRKGYRSCSVCPARAQANKSEMVKFLKKMRTEQVGAITTELDRLHSIEEYIANSESLDEETFERFFDPKDKDLQVFLAEKLRKLRNNNPT